MQNKGIGNNIIYSFLSNAQDVTKRAIRLSEEQNPEKYERESIGALMQALGFDFPSLLKALELYPSIFNFDENIKKLRVMNNFKDMLVKETSQFSEKANLDFKALTGFFKVVFQKYTNKFEGKLDFNCFDIFDENMKTKIGTIIRVESIDLTSSFYEPAKTKDFLLNTTVGETYFSIQSIFDDVLNYFDDYYEEEKANTTHSIQQTVKMSETRDYSSFPLMLMIQNKKIGKNELYLEKFSLNYNNQVIINSTELVDDIICTDTFISINGIEYSNSNKIKDHEKFLPFLQDVIKSLKIENNQIIDINLKRILELQSKDEYEDTDRTDDILNTLCNNILSAILNEISSGLSLSFKKASNNLELYRPAFYTMQKNILKKKWNLEDDNTYSRTIEI